MGIMQSFSGSVSIRITAADPTRLISEMNHMSIAAQNVVSEDMLTVSCTISQKDYRKVKKITEKHGGQMILLGREGLYWNIKGVLLRPFLVLGIIFVLGLTLFLPTRVLFLQVNGNETIPTQLILEQAKNCGITFGASRQEVRSERLKNKLLSALPQLQWAGINTAGCVATITVRERQDTDIQEQGTGVSSIVATRDGIISELTVTKGNPLCKVGEAVKQGQTLVSGYTDCGISIKASQAEAEVHARTYRSVRVTALQTISKKAQITERQPFFCLIIGNTQHYLYGGSAPAYREGCIWQKTTHEYVLTLPGGFSLPVKAVIGEYVCYQTDSCNASTAEKRLLNFARNYALSQMVSGRIISEANTIKDKGNNIILLVEFSCEEMIGKVRWESPISIPPEISSK